MTARVAALVSNGGGIFFVLSAINATVFAALLVMVLLLALG